MDVPPPIFQVIPAATFPVVRTQTKLWSRDLAELSLGFVLVLLALWSEKQTQLILGAIAFAWMVIATIRSHASAAELGLSLSGTRRSLWVIGIAALLAVLGAWIAVREHTFHAVFRHYAVVWSFAAYIVWALMQQFILQDFFLLRLLRILPTRTNAVIAAALLFAIAHLPNPLLVIATVVWGLVACALFLRYRNLYVLGVAHAIFGMCLAVTIPSTVHHDMRVGLGYFHWHAGPPRHQRNHNNQIVSTEACVIADATSR
jgi:membrane protease YdiL (CAAX protease family)